MALLAIHPVILRMSEKYSASKVLKIAAALFVTMLTTKH